MENSYISKARCVLAPGSSNQIATNMKNLLLDEAREKKMSLVIKNLIVHSYPCKCVYSASGYVNNKEFEIVGKEEKLINAFIDIHNQIFDKYGRN